MAVSSLLLVLLIPMLLLVGEKPVRAAKPKRRTVFDTINAATQHAGVTASAPPVAKRSKFQSATEVQASRASLLTLQLQVRLAKAGVDASRTRPTRLTACLVAD